jgi:hypothetical protein
VPKKPSRVLWQRCTSKKKSGKLASLVEVFLCPRTQAERISKTRLKKGLKALSLDLKCHPHAARLRDMYRCGAGVQDGGFERG